MSDLDHVSRANADYVEQQYQRYRVDPSSVDERWALFFAGFEMGTTGNGHGPSAAPETNGGSEAETNGHAAPARILVLA
jgi:2-oxoglutarate dehydrogenase complex dehydrogenase (E1) component-like enzyme